jgi:FtsP/CotA-like multicopper oxidase with cupredoxin domain
MKANRAAAAQRAGIAADALVLEDAIAAPDLVTDPATGYLIPDYFGGTPNWANSPIPDFTDPANCPPPNYCGMRKFVDSLPLPNAPNNLGSSLPVAVPDTTSYAGADYYEIALVEYEQQLHSDLPPTRLRGYVQEVNGTQVGTPQYLGPVIVAQKGRPVRIKFTNRLPTGTGGNLFLPVDATIMGAGPGPNGTWTDPPTPADQQCKKTGGLVPATCYTENRATLHLHGGVTPWISDGTPHQWITPAGESTGYPEGVSVYNVPDMPNPGKPGGGTNPVGSGSQTFYYSNEQSARLMFYHDHAWGLTRLNVYAGEAAGYVLQDAVEHELVNNGIIPALGIPLVIQDKTFVDARRIQQTDPTWVWGTGPQRSDNPLFRTPKTGDLWWPHVYMTAQNPYDLSGTNAMGRWVYGPWFWPPTTGIPFKEVPNPYYDCGAGGACTRPEQPPTMPGTPQPSWGAEAFLDTPTVNGTAYPYLEVPAGPVRFRVLNAAHDRFFNLSLYEASDGTLPDGTVVSKTEVALNASEVLEAKLDPFGVFPTPDAAPGPDWLYIGTEGGFLPKPVVVPAQPITWVSDPTVFNAGNVDEHSLLLGPAERADVIVDFSGYAGKTLILYNDAPAAFPARDPRYDYYTDNADLTDTGGSPTTVPGFGPNTRTVMQIRVVGGGGGPFDRTRLEAAFRSTANQPDGQAGVFQRSQDPIIVGQTAYNETYDTTFPATYPNWGIGRIQDFAINFQTVDGRTVTLNTEPKAIQDEMGESFDDYGRMSAMLGLERPFTQAGNQNFVLQRYVDPPTELVKLSGVSPTLIGTADDGTQIWRITHNGVDTHPVHFHLFHVQLINRVGWDGAIRLPHPTELGWKDTVRISPLEDTFVALRPVTPNMTTLPFKVPNSVRPLNPAAPIGSTFGFTNLDPVTGQGISTFNELTNFGYEYVWHCHILSHEENDMMRGVVFAFPPDTPVLSSTVSGAGTARQVTLTWTTSLLATNFTVQRATDAAFTNAIDIPAGNVTTFTETIGNSAFHYRVRASNVVGSTAQGYHTITSDSAYSNAVAISAPVTPGAPTGLTAVVEVVQPDPLAVAVRLTWTDTAVNETAFEVQRAAVGAPFTLLATVGPLDGTGTVSYTDTAVSVGQTWRYRVRARNGALLSAFSNTLSVPLTVPAAPGSVRALVARTGATDRVTISWLDASNNEAGFVIERASDSAFTQNRDVYTVGANVRSFAQTVNRGLTFYYRVQSTNAIGSSAFSNATPFPIVTP